MDLANTKLSSVELIRTGQCRCIDEPKGKHGLEGYQLNESYKYQIVRNEDETYMRVYPSAMFPDFYETCGSATFKRYFKPLF